MHIMSRALPLIRTDKNDKKAKKRIGTKQREHGLHILSELMHMFIVNM